MGMLTGVVSSVMDWLASLANIALAVLPNSPIKGALDDFGAFTGTLQNILGWINYFVPLGIMFNIMSAYVTCVLIYYGIRLVLRWAKYIE
jgi:hypothetical protein